MGDVEMVFAKHTEDKSTQTCFLFTSEVDSISMDHTYTFSFEDIIDIKESRQSIQEQLEVKEEMLINLKKKVGQLQKEIDEYKQREFTLEKFKNDNSAIKFYTGFPNYKALLAFHNYLKPKVAKLQYWGQKNVPDSRPYQEEGKNKPGRKRQLSSLTELFIVFVRLKVGLFVRDLVDRFGISVANFSKIFCTWINSLYLELPQLFPFPSQESARKNMP